MSVDTEQAIDIILGIFKAAWDPLAFPAVYDDLPDNKPTSETVWARATIRHADGRQASLSGAHATRRYKAVGTVFVQVFAPVGDGSTACYEAAKVVLDAYRDARNPDVWFRDVRLKEIGNGKGAFTQINVEATFSYDEVR